MGAIHTFAFLNRHLLRYLRCVVGAAHAAKAFRQRTYRGLRRSYINLYQPN